MTLNPFKQLGMKWKSKSCTVFIISTPSFFDLTYMLLQNNCVNNSVSNGLKQKKEKNHAKEFHVAK